MVLQIRWGRGNLGGVRCKHGCELKELDTDPEIVSTIREYLEGWHSGTALGEITVSDRLQQAVLQQTNLGWDSMLEGRISKEWARLQLRHYQLNGSRRNGARWATAIITKLLNVAWDQWEHRNGIAHASATSARELDPAVNRELEWLYRQGPRDLPVVDRVHFSRPIEELLEASGTVRRAWIRSVKIAWSRHHRRLQSTYQQERLVMARWLRLGTDQGEV